MNLNTNVTENNGSSQLYQFFFFHYTDFQMHYNMVKMFSLILVHPKPYTG